MPQEQTTRSREDRKPSARPPVVASAVAAYSPTAAQLAVVLHETMAVADLDAAEQDRARWDGVS